MHDVVVGLLMIIVGALFCFRGFIAMRVIIPVWGAFAGFLLGAGLVDSASDDGFLRTALGWIVGIAIAVLFGAIAYFYYEVCVLLAMAAIGFVLGTTAMVLLGVTWTWVIIMIGVVGGALLAFVAIAGDLPMMLLVVLTALAGATTIVLGIMLLGGVIDTLEFDSAATTDGVDDDWWWYALFGVLAAVGIVAQLRHLSRLTATLREQWAGSGGQQLRST
jgi:hypothetical protein